MELVFADENGRIFNFPGLKACGMKAGNYFEPKAEEWIKLPPSSEFFRLPDHFAVGLDPDTGKPQTLVTDPYSSKDEPIFAVAAFTSPGHTLLYNAAYEESTTSKLLPLFAYGAVGFHNDQFYISAVQVDAGTRHDERQFHPDKIAKGIEDYKKLFPVNRLVPHLAGCATTNACANAKNFFLGRMEAPIPTSPVCNAQCQGCISFQPREHHIPPTQNRIEFIPTPEEIAEVALYQMDREADPIVSFGQGCEGEPTLSGEVIEKAIRLIRKKSSKGAININTNASRPKTLEKLFDAGLNHIRVSTNSVREPYYSRYYQPKGYSFEDVTASVDVAKKYKGFVSLNYLSMPGFTDSREENDALIKFVGEHGVDMIQWRNLNYDPRQYFRDLKCQVPAEEMLGMKEAMERVKKEHAKIKMGYFNPSRNETAQMSVDK